jgi:hypothetical protein
MRRSISDPTIAIAVAPDATTASMQGPNQLAGIRQKAATELSFSSRLSAFRH